MPSAETAREAWVRRGTPGSPPSTRHTNGNGNSTAEIPRRLAEPVTMIFKK